MDEGPIVIAGSSGFVGSALCEHWSQQGRSFIRLVRRPAQSANEREWDPAKQNCDSDIFKHASAVLNLAGASVADGNWSSARKDILLSSRLDTTNCLVSALQQSGNTACRYMSASGVGYYGDSPVLNDESGALGEGFLAKLCHDWESAAANLDHSHAATFLRIGVVLGPNGGALQKMLPPMRWGIGGRLGSGKQWMSWIALRDVIAAIEFLLDHAECSGPVNVVSPEPIQNADFLRCLAGVMNKPFWAHVPGWVLRLRFGQMAKEILLQHNRACPKLLQDAGFVFGFPELESCFKDILGVNDES